MANTNQTATVEIDVVVEPKTIKELRKELKGYREDILNAESGTEEYRQAVIKAGQAQEQLDDVMEVSRGAAMDWREAMSGTVSEVTKGLSAISGGFTAYKGIVALTGKENKALEETFVKLQSVMAITQGLTALSSGIGNIGKSLNTLKGIMLAHPITFWATVIAGVGAALVALIKNISDTNGAMGKLRKENELINEQQAKLQVTTDRQVKLMELEGKSIQEIINYKIRQYEVNLALEEQERVNTIKQLERLKERRKGWERFASILNVTSGGSSVLANLTKFSDEAKGVKKLNTEIEGLTDSILDQKLALQDLKKEYSDVVSSSKDIKDYWEETANIIANRDLGKVFTTNNTFNKPLTDTENKLGDTVNSGINPEDNIDEINSYTAAVISSAQQEVISWQDRMNAVGQYLDVTTNVMGSITKLYEQNYQNKLQEAQLDGKITKEEEKMLKKAFEQQKAAQYAQAVVAGLLAVQQALSSGPPPINFILAGAVGVATIANVAAIASTKIGSMSGSAGGNTTLPNISLPNNATTQQGFDEETFNNIQPRDYPTQVVVVEDIYQGLNNRQVKVNETTF